MADYQLEVAVPVLARAAREWGPWPELDALVEDLTRVVSRRGMVALLALLEREAVQSEGPAAAGPSAVEREAED